MMSKEERRANPLDVVKPPFPFETLADDLRRKVLEFVLAAPPDAATKCRGGGECEFLDDVMLKIKTATHPDAKALDEVLLWVPIVEGVFNAFCECTFVGLN